MSWSSQKEEPSGVPEDGAPVIETTGILVAEEELLPLWWTLPGAAEARPENEAVVSWVASLRRVG